MKRVAVWSFAVLFLLIGLSVAVAEDITRMDLKVGDEVYVCGCGESCPCHTMSMNPGNCTCGSPLVKAKVTKTEAGSAMLMVNGKERAFKTTAKYACACGPACKCNTISQNPGKCACGEEMKEVSAKN